MDTTEPQWMIKLPPAIFGMNAIIVMRSCNVGICAPARNEAVRLAQSRGSPNANGAYSAELGGGFYRSFLGDEAASAVETRWRNPHFAPVSVLGIGGWLRQPFRRSDEFLFFEDGDGSVDVGVARPEERCDRLRTMIVR